jgi:hypothetical protein
MSSGDFQRSVKGRRYERSAGDAPNLGRVARMPRGESKGERRRRRRLDGAGGGRVRASNRVVVLAWSAVLTVATLALVVVFLVMWLKSSRQTSRAEATKFAAPREERVESRFPSPSEKEALALVSRALSLTEPAGVDECFRPGGASKEEILDFLRVWREGEGKGSRNEWLSSMDANGLLLDGVLVITGEYPEEKNRLALLTPDESGRWKIDFEAFSRTVRPAWEQILDAASAGGVVRVMVAKDSYFNGPFRESDGWTCFGIASPDIKTNLYGYCRQESVQDKAMKRLFASPDDPEEAGKVRRTTLELGRIAGSGPRQFEIRRVLAEDWVVSDNAFDGSVR